MHRIRELVSKPRIETEITQREYVKHQVVKYVRNIIEASNRGDLTCFPIYAISMDSFYEVCLGIAIRKESDMVSLTEWYDWFINKMSKINKFNNINRLTLNYWSGRLRLHYEKYGRYLELFSQIMFSRESITPGHMLRDELESELRHRNIRYKVYRNTTRDNDLMAWLSRGDLVVDKTDGNLGHIRYGYSVDYSTYGKSVSYGSLLYSTPTQINCRMSVVSRKYKWIQALARHLIIQNTINLPMVDASQGNYECRKIKLYISEKNTKSMTYEGVGFVEKCKSGTINKIVHGNNELYINGNAITTDSADRMIKDIIRLSLIVDNVHEITINMGTQVMIKYGHEVNKSDYLIEIYRKRIMNKADASLTFIAGKGEGKSALVKFVSEDEYWKDSFIEDSDDFGIFIHYLMVKYGAVGLDDLEKKVTSQIVITEVSEFYEVEMKETLKVSWYNYILDVKLEGMFNGVNGSTDKLNSIICFSSNWMMGEINKFNNSKIVNQRNFQLGMKTYMRSKGLTKYVGLLHSYNDYFKRDPSDVILRYTARLNTNNVIMQRAMHKGESKEKMYADLILSIVYQKEYDYNIPLVTVNQIYKFLGHRVYLLNNGEMGIIGG